MKVPATIATPSTIATAVKIVRSLRPSSPSSANLTIGAIVRAARSRYGLNVIFRR